MLAVAALASAVAAALAADARPPLPASAVLLPSGATSCRHRIVHQQSGMALPGRPCEHHAQQANDACRQVRCSKGSPET